MNATKLCSIDGCERSKTSRGWCQTHYMRWRTHGDPLGGNTRYDTPEESFKARTQWNGDCLIWTGNKSNGYGRIVVNGENQPAHRYAWERSQGEIPQEIFIDHICHNPACVNVEHLRLATVQQNIAHRAGPHWPGTASGIRNVYKSKNKWMVRVTKNGVVHSFGAYHTTEEAALVAEQARKELFGEYAGRG